MVRPGQTKFRLRRLDSPTIDKTTGMRYDFGCDDLAHPPCSNCYRGWIYVAYGINSGVWDVYRFPCACSGMPNGREFWQLIDPRWFKNRPVDAQYTQEELPPYVFVHPIHTKQYQHVLRSIKALGKRADAQQESELPF